MFYNFEPVSRFEKMWYKRIRNFDNSASKRVLNVLKSIYLRVK